MKITPFREDIDQAYKNDFKDNDIYPFNQIRRVLVDSVSGSILSELDPMDSRYRADGSYIDVREDIIIMGRKYEWMTYIPVFSYKREWDGEVMIDKISTEVPSVLEDANGFKIHPTFLKSDGSIAPYILYGCFPNMEVGNSLLSIPIGAYRSSLGVALTPKYGYSLSAHISGVRDSRQTPSKWFVENIFCWSAIQLLAKVGFQNLDLQSVLGDGEVYTTNYRSPGVTASLGNRSGSVYRNFYDIKDNAVLSSSISLFGIEDFYGGHFRFLDGVLSLSQAWYVANYVDSDTSQTSWGGYHVIEANNDPIGNRVIKNMRKISGKYDFLNIPKDTESLDNFSTPEDVKNRNYSDIWWKASSGDENIKMVCVSGNMNNGLYCGLYTLCTLYTYGVSGYFTTRTLFIP